MSSTEENLIDMSFLRSFTGDNKEKMSRYINMFLQTAPAQLDNIEKTLRSGDFDSLRVSAHSLKPQLSYMGIKSQEPVVRMIEDYAGNQVNIDQLPALVSNFKSSLEAAFEQLRAELDLLK